ncbi:DsbA family oxidoreductase [Heyndrickxia sp. NPDC080065]|uniref:DsbA family oxidoreductase n=1 Tax=Heyndrickxia sp. NPDC080065 TaxID=3390568 RepID=UPI003CFD0486
MKIEVWSDYVCPFCYIGKRRLEEALSQFPEKDKVEVVFRSFELDPNSKKDINLNIHEVLAKKYGMSVEQAKQMNENVGKQAEEVGLTYHFDTMVPTNTFDAHRLAKYAEDNGKSAEMSERLLKAYFTDSKKISDSETLADLAAEIGLNREDAISVLKGSDYSDSVRSDEEEARQIGVSGVPFFVINEKYAISGAQPTEAFSNALNMVWEEEKGKTPLKMINPKESKSEYCTDEGCVITED